MSHHPRTILDRYGISPKKSLGQNFLWDDNILARIAAAAELTPEDQVLEIGPGLGALTHHLARSAAHVVAVELDDRLLPILRQELAPHDNVTLVHGDILDQDLAQLFSTDGYKVVANVPYYITGAILRHLLDSRVRPAVLVLTVQKEVADRLSAEPPNMSLLAVATQLYGSVTAVHTLKAGAFWPRPDVDSAIVHIDLQHAASLDPEREARVLRVVRTGFSQKRKQLKNNLRRLGLEKAQVAAALAAAGIDGRRRAETLTVDEWLRLEAALFA